MKRSGFIIIALVLCCSLAAKDKERDYQPFDRGLAMPNSLFIPKGTIGMGLSGSYSSASLGDAAGSGYSVLYSVLGGVRGNLVTGGVSPQFEGFVADNVSLGARFSYGRTELKLDEAAISMGDLLSLNLGGLSYVTQSYKGAITVRDYMPILGSKRFAIIVEGRLAGGYAVSKMTKIEDGLLHGTYQKSFTGGLYCVPGICCFILDNIDFEVQLGVLGVDFSKIIQTENQVNTSSAQNFNASFQINLLSVELGVKFYILDKYHRPKKAE